MNLIDLTTFPKVIGISGNMGSGKTTLTRVLATTLNSTALHWDDFDEISNGPDDYVDWYHRSGDYAEWDYKPLANVLKTLKSNQSITHPTLHTTLEPTLEPTPLIIFDAPNSRLHLQTAEYIDLAIHINLPLDISLARWVIRDFKSSDKTKDDLIEELEFYLAHSRPLFIDDDIKSTADLIIDGTLPTQLQVQEIQKYLTIILKSQK